jgi:hypothetical protein
MTHRNPVARISRPASRSAALGLVFAMLAACAPDAVQNYDATGFNGYLRKLQSACPNLQIGNSDIGLWLEYHAVTDNYDYWLDMTSKLYYNRISPAQYRDGVTGQLGPGSFNARSFDCIIGNLPAERPDAPPPVRLNY